MSVGRLFEMGALTSIPRVFDFATRFARTVILAHVLSPAEFGISLALAAALTIGELVSDFGVEQFLISRRPGNEAATLAGAHALLVVRGLVVGIVFFAAAPWMAQLFGIAGNVASFRWIAGILAVRGFEHLEIAQLQRDFRYRGEALARFMARLLSFVSVFPAVFLLPDHHAILVSLSMFAGSYVCASHLLAKSPYRISFSDRRTIREAIAYGLPLTINGIGIAANSQIDRALVSLWLGVATLALYGVILNLALAPVTLALGVLGALAMPFLVRARGGPDGLAEGYAAIDWIYGTVSAAYALGIAVALGWLVPRIFGRAYQVGPVVQALVSMIAWARLYRNGAPTVLLLVEGDTGRVMIGNLLSGSGAVAIALALPFWPHLETTLAGILFGEALSLAFLLHAASRRAAARFRGQARVLCWSLAPALLAAAGALVPQGHAASRFAAAAAATAMVAAHALFGFRRHVVRGGLWAALAPMQAPAAAPPSVGVAVNE